MADRNGGVVSRQRGPVARPRPGPMLVNKVAQYCYYIPNAPELISERVRIKKFPGGTPALTNPPRFARLILDHYNLFCSGPVDTFIAQKR